MSQHPIELLQLSSQKTQQFIGKGITSVEELAQFFPRRYIDFRTITKAQDALVGQYCAMQGEIIDIRQGDKTYTLTLQEPDPLPSGYRPTFSVVWFSVPYYSFKFEVGKSFVFCGKVSVFRSVIQINPVIAFSEDPSEVCRITPIYSKIKGMSTDYMLDKIKMAIDFMKTSEPVGEKDLFADSLHIMRRMDAIEELHHPASEKSYRDAAYRVAFDEIYDFYEELKRKDLYLVGTEAASISKDKMTRAAASSLPFALTPDQTAAMETIIREAKEGRRIRSLISGDVGCGKTVIAILSSILMWENRLQTIVMAPTLVLARQHFQEFQRIAVPLDVNIALLTTETKKKERQIIVSEFTEGKIDILIGTHAVLNDEIVPHKLGMTIIDEEHKFGVRQKERMEEFDRAGVHHLSMTATPIPRSIAMSVYGRDLAVIPIRTMPSGRKPVITSHCASTKDAFETIYRQIEAGKQAYIVCPFIEDSENEKFKNVISAAAAKKAAEKYFAGKPRRVRVGLISGDMKQQDIMETIDRFRAGRLDVLVSTTIVEVGVNVPNATIIAIMSAERFGLAALHQLRGRVGRGDDQSYCLLCSPVRTQRLDVLCGTTDGFAIAEQDLALRGPGDLNGEAQSGASKVIETILRFPKLAEAIRKRVFKLQ